MTPSQPVSDLFSTVVSNGCCIGCGSCAAFDPAIQIKLDAYGRYAATRQSATTPIHPSAARVCPFADGVANEDTLAQEVFGDADAYDPHIGRHVATYAGWVAESDFRARGSSGGLASWVLTELLDRGLVDSVVHVTAEPSPEAGKPLFRFAISSTSEQVRARSKSRYYPVEMSGVMREMIQRPGRYAVVGIPCFIKALRLACRESAVLKERLAFTVGIVCGHLKSSAFAESFAWQCGIAPAELRMIDFRTKLPDRPASSYAITASGERDGQSISVTKPTSELFGSNWGHGLFKYKACEFCDDVVGETADISIGDAWLPEYVNDAGGTNVVVVRSQTLKTLIAEAASAGRLHLDEIPAAKVVQSQAGGFRHRRDGLAYRLFLEDQAGRWRPAKRVAPLSRHLTPKLQRIYSARYDLVQSSHESFACAKERQDLNFFLDTMRPLAARYDMFYQRPLPLRLLGKIKRKLLALVRGRR
ncbi:MAG: Coenzyme F420 hydrogenase/dehydrogenase, beta subunit C-terminal domain [Verrucomicrobia bacterium]|nr:Coenzyme F420 hydrogenase/dehydrogenase, beta subunit C-terminal domain [Verrucomicrobiota bacterium]